MVRCGVVCCGVVCCGVVAAVWCAAVRCGVVWCGVLRVGVVADCGALCVVARWRHTVKVYPELIVTMPGIYARS